MCFCMKIQFCALASTRSSLKYSQQHAKVARYPYMICVYQTPTRSYSLDRDPPRARPTHMMQLGALVGHTTRAVLIQLKLIY